MQKIYASSRVMMSGPRFLYYKKEKNWDIPKCEAITNVILRWVLQKKMIIASKNHDSLNSIVLKKYE